MFESGGAPPSSEQAARPALPVGTLRKHRVDDAGKARHRLIRRSFRTTKTGVDALADAKRVSCLPPGWRGLAGVSGSLPMRLMFAEGPLCLRGDLLVAGVVKSAPARGTTTCERVAAPRLSFPPSLSLHYQPPPPSYPIRIPLRHSLLFRIPSFRHRKTRE